MEVEIGLNTSLLNAPIEGESIHFIQVNTSTQHDVECLFNEFSHLSFSYVID